MSDWETEWKGTKSEQDIIIKEITAYLKSRHFKEISDKKFNKLFAEAL